VARLLASAQAHHQPELNSITDRLPPMATIARRTVDLDASALEAFLRELWQVVTPSEKQAIQGHLPPTRDP